MLGSLLVNEEALGWRTTFSYDGANQLLTEHCYSGSSPSQGYRATYTYDGLGNRLTQVNVGDVRTSYVYDAANQLLTEQTGNLITTFSYDLNGNRTLENTLGALTTFVWDEENRLTQQQNSNGTSSSFVLSDDGLRRKVTEGGATTLMVWDGTQLLQEKDASTGLETVRYLLQNGAYDGLRAERKASDNVWRFFAYDVQGSNRMLLNADGSAAGTALYRAFGERVAQSGLSSRFGYGAQHGYQKNDALTAYLLWVKARIEDGKRGGWISPDPIGFAGGDWNLWRYVGNRPINQSDTTGMAPKPSVPDHATAFDPHKNRPPQCLCISGSDQNPNTSQWGWTFDCLRPACNKTLFKPSKQTVIQALVQADCFYFWGHGYESGKIILNENGEKIEISDINMIATLRNRLGKPKMSYVSLDACHSGAHMNFVNAWLGIANRFTGFCTNTIILPSDKPEPTNSPLPK